MYMRKLINFEIIESRKLRGNVQANISTLDQRCFNVVDHRWNNVDPTLEIKQNPMSDFKRCTTLMQCHCLTLKQRRNNVTQRQNNVAHRWYNIDTTLFQPSVDVSESCIESNWASDDCGLWDSWIHVKYMNSFYSVKSRNIFLLYINNSTTNEIWKNFLTVVHIVIRNVGNNGDMQRSLKCCIQNFKTSLENIKI